MDALRRRLEGVLDLVLGETLRQRLVQTEQRIALTKDRSPEQAKERDTSVAKEMEFNFEYPPARRLFVKIAASCVLPFSTPCPPSMRALLSHA